MFSRFDFAWSAEAVFSRWAIKRVCKFLLKKRLGNLIVGDIDLDQLDVQLSRGTIQLNDLALNVDYLNHKLAGAAVMVKEGSIGSLSVKVPLKLKNCQIEVEELELVLSPNVASTAGKNSSGVPGDNSQRHLDSDSTKPESGAFQGSPGPTSIDVHEGVKTIAKIVKWLLTSFHVRLKNLIVAYDPTSDGEGKRSSLSRSLVLRIAELEFGTCISEEIGTTVDQQPDPFRVFGRLTNFIKFKGAVVEFLKLEEVNDVSLTHGDMATSFSEWYASSFPSKSTTTVLTGMNCGISGTLNLSIPWKNGSFDIRKVDAEISVEPIELIVQPSIINEMILICDSLKNTSSDIVNQHYDQSMDPNSCYSRIHHSSEPSSSVKAAFAPAPEEPPSETSYSPLNKQTPADGILQEAHVIQDWVPLSVGQEGDIKLDTDYGTSIDQFFSCFDGMRSYQATAGANSIWNWTCSVFNAITVASSLASGSGHIPTEQQHIETNVQATIAGISFVILFHSEENNWSNSFPISFEPKNDSSEDAGSNFCTGKFENSFLSKQTHDTCSGCLSSLGDHLALNRTGNSDIHHIEAKCQNVVLNLQIYHRKLMFEASIGHIEIDEFRGNGFVAGLGQPNGKDVCAQVVFSQHLQSCVLGSLPAFPLRRSHCADDESLKADAPEVNHGTTTLGEFSKVILFESFGLCSCSYVSSCADSNGKSVTSAVCSLTLPPFMSWVHLELVNKILCLLKQVKFSLGRHDCVDGIHDVSPDDTNHRSSTGRTDANSGTSIQVNISIPNARMILCFPSEDHAKLGCSMFFDKFIVLDLSERADTGQNTDIPQNGRTNSTKGSSCRPSISTHLDIGNIEAYLVTSDKSCPFKEVPIIHDQSFTAIQLLSVSFTTRGQNFGLTTVWQKGPVTGSWMANRAWSLATTYEQRKSRVTVRGNGSSSMATAGNFEETSPHVRQELILSSEVFVHIHFAYVHINLRQCDYKLINSLVDHILAALSNGADIAKAASNRSFQKESSLPDDLDPTQASFLVECDTLDVCITLDELIQSTSSVQRELPASWSKFRLITEKFELLCVSNIGKINCASLLYMNHGEGDLFGTINEEGYVESKDFLLISCRNSVRKRGDGDGINGFSFATAGTSITHVLNPQLLQKFTSINVWGATIVAPGGRLDWVSSLCSFFKITSPEIEKAGGDGSDIKGSDGVEYSASFFLELVDIGVSYQPYGEYPMVSSDFPDFFCSPGAEPDDQSEEKSVACLLAATSFSLCHHNSTDSTRRNYKFLLQDVGLLICESNGVRSERGEYHVAHLQNSGYVKVAKAAVVEASLRINGEQWEIESSDSCIDLDSCRDTTFALSRLIAQLQQLYAPDIEDAMLHLQSRGSAAQMTESDSSVDIVKFPDTILTRENAVSISRNENNKTIGLLDEILDNAFHPGGEFGPAISLPEMCFDVLPGKGMLEYPSKEITLSSAIGTELIESYCQSVEFPPSRPTLVSYPLDQDHTCKNDIIDCRESDFRKGGWYDTGSLLIVENHISRENNQSDGEEPQQQCSSSSGRSDSSFTFQVSGKLILMNVDVRWRMYVGYDWPRSTRNLQCNSNSNGRDKKEYLELCLSKIKVQYEIYPIGELLVWKLSLSVEDFHLSDGRTDAPWDMVLGYYHSKDHPRESLSNAFKFDLESVKPDASTPLEEYRLNLQFLPLRLHLDQSQLNFLIRFFGAESGVVPDHVDDTKSGRKKLNLQSHTIVVEELLPFFQKCVIRPVVLRVDYIPRHIDLAALRGGNYAELLNLVPWKGIDLHLKDVCAVGIYGWSSICETVFGEWLEDISHNQVHKLLKGLAPIRSLVAVSSAASKLVSMPVKSYKRDQKLLKGLQRGAIAFVKSISVEAVGLGIHLAGGAHDVLLQTEYILTSIPQSIPEAKRHRNKASVRCNQPKDAREGMQQARESLSHGLNRTASALVGKPIKTYQRGAGAGSALATAVRAAPVAAIAPVSASARAVHCALVGFRNSLDPDHKRDSMQKYLGPSHHCKEDSPF